MEATETDFPYVQDKAIVEGQVDGLAEGIMELMENPDPDHSAEAAPKPASEPAAEEPAEANEGAGEPEETQAKAEEPGKFTIKWQGQEKEVTQDELLQLAQQGFDYTQKTQQLAAERDQLAPIAGFAQRIKSDPILAAQIANILAGKAPEAQPPIPAAGKKFDDPIEQLKWETKQEAIAEIRKEMQANLIPLHRQQALNQVKNQIQADPDFREIHQQIIEMVKSQPPAIQKTLYLQLDQDPRAYLETFAHFKNIKAQKSTPEALPKPTKKETRAPILEAGGVSSPGDVRSKEKTQRLSKQKAAALRSGNPMAIAEWLQDSGAIEHLY
ncbi:MAG: hypothetical protein WBK67_03145 [Minisyncoccales bacterium]